MGSLCQRAGLIQDVPLVGRRRKMVCVRQRILPELEALGRMYAACADPVYPGRETVGYQGQAHAVALIRLFLVAGYTLGLRLEDLMRLEWSQIGTDAVTVRARKTGKEQRLPLHPVLERHLQLVSRRKEGVFWPMKWSGRHKLRRTLKELCKDAGVPVVTPQQLRRLAGTEYEKAHGGAGRLLLGHGWPSRATAFYVDEFAILQEASRKLRLPREWLTDDERQETENDEVLLARAYRAMSKESRVALMKVAVSLQ